MDESQPKDTSGDESALSGHLAELLSQLTVDQIKFVVARQQYSKDKAAAESIGIKPDLVKRWKYEGVPIDEAVLEVATDGLLVAQAVRHRNLVKAMMIKVDGLDSGDERLRQSIATEIIEGEMGKPTQRQEVTGRAGGPIVVVNWDEPSDSA